MMRAFTRLAAIVTALLLIAGVLASASVPASAASDENLAPSGQPSASFTAGHNNLFTVNDGVHTNSGPPENSYWGTWVGSGRPATHYLQYDWAEPVSVDRSVISFWTDAAGGAGDNVAVPQSWGIEYWDASNKSWKPVTNPSSFGTSRTGTNATTFDGVETTRLRAIFQAFPNAAGTSYSALGVSEWEVWGAPADSPSTSVVEVPAVHVRTKPGGVLALPAQLKIVRLNGARDLVTVQWDEVDTADLVDGAEVSVAGRLVGLTETAEATIWVRDEPSTSIEAVDDVSVITMTTRRPMLLGTVTVTYDDGSKDSAVPVTWSAVAAADYAEVGSFEVRGVVDGTDLGATAYVFVEPSDGSVQESSFSLGLSPGDPDGSEEWYRSPVVVGITPDDGVPGTYEAMVNLSPWATVDRTFELSADGTYRVGVRETGASAEPEFIDVKIDRTQPVSEAEFDPSARTLTLSAADGMSGVERIEYRGVGDWTTYDGPISTGTSAREIDFRAIDVAGNVEKSNTASVPGGGGQLASSVTGAVLTQSTTAYGRPAELRVRVNGGSGTPTGRVVVSSGGNRLADAELRDGRATVALPSTIAVGAHQLTVAYAGDQTFAPSTDAVTLTVAKATSSVRSSVRPTKVTPRQRAVVRWSVAAPGTDVTGTVRVTVHRGSKLMRSRTFSAASRSWKMPKLAKAGKYTVRIAYRGSATVEPSASKFTVRVR